MLPVRVTSAGIVSPARARTMRSRLSRMRAAGSVGLASLPLDADVPAADDVVARIEEERLLARLEELRSATAAGRTRGTVHALRR